MAVDAPSAHGNHLIRPPYRADIDGLRAIAVLSVVGFHAFPSVATGGFIGVDIFFVISGFLISTIVFDNLARGRFSFAAFYGRRIRRIFPALFVVMAACLAFGWIALLPDEYEQLGKHIAGGAGFVSNFILWNESGYFDNATVTKPLVLLWSLGIEEQFYIGWPLLLWLAWRLRIDFATITVALLAISFTMNVYTSRIDMVADFYSPQTRIWELLAGSLLAYLTLHDLKLLPAIKKRVLVWVGNARFSQAETRFETVLADLQSICGALLIVIGFLVITKERRFPGFWAVLPVLGAAMIIAAGTRAWLNSVVLSNRVLVWFGLISFPLYLWHWPLLSFARIVIGTTPEQPVRVAAVLVSIMLAWLTYLVIEKPMRLGGHGGSKAILLVSLMAVVGFVGYITYASEGLEHRSSVKQYTNNRNELVRTPALDDGCKTYIGDPAPGFPYCRFTYAGERNAVAVIGDSHAHVAYPGIAAALRDSGISTVLLANSGCPPFIGSEYGKTAEEKNLCRERINKIIEIVRKKDEIRHVFVFSRGPIYISGRGFGEAERDVSGPPSIPAEIFRNALQRTVDVLRMAGKQVYYVTENPEMGVSPDACFARPLRTNVTSCEVDLGAVRTRQHEYLAVVESIRGATALNSLSAFCTSGICKAFAKDGALLYSDSNHLSIAGSRFLAASLLAPVLSRIRVDIHAR